LVPCVVYVKSWVLDLLNVDSANVMDSPAPVMRLAPGYPSPIVDHSVARDITLDLFKSAAAR